MSALPDPEKGLCASRPTRPASSSEYRFSLALPSVLERVVPSSNSRRVPLTCGWSESSERLARGWSSGAEVEAASGSSSTAAASAISAAKARRRATGIRTATMTVRGAKQGQLPQNTRLSEKASGALTAAESEAVLPRDQVEIIRAGHLVERSPDLRVDVRNSGDACGRGSTSNKVSSGEMKTNNRRKTHPKRSRSRTSTPRCRRGKRQY